MAKYTNYEKKVTLYNLHNAFVTAMTNATADNMSTLKETLTTACKAHDIEANENTIDALVIRLIPACTRTTLKGKLGEQKAFVKVMSIGTIKKAITCGKWETVTTALDAPEQKKHEPKPERVVSVEEQMARIEYNAAKQKAKLTFAATHNLDGTHVVTGAKETFSFPAFFDSDLGKGFAPAA